MAYAINITGEALGDEETFTTSGGSGNETGFFIDSRDNHEYQWVEIGNQTWMAENLAFLPSVNPSSSWSSSEPRFYVYDYQGSTVNDATVTINYSTYGVLYNWPAVMLGATSSNTNPSGVQGVCPNGWHMPSDEEWKQLEKFLGMSQSEADDIGYRGIDQGSQLADSASLWRDGRLKSDPKFGLSGFDALPGGYRNYDDRFQYQERVTAWWSTTESSSYPSGAAFYRQLWDDYTGVLRSSNTGNHSKENGISVRCVRDL